MHALHREPLDEFIFQYLSRRAHIPSNNDRRALRVCFSEHVAIRSPEFEHDLFIKFCRVNATNIICFVDSSHTSSHNCSV